MLIKGTTTSQPQPTVHMGRLAQSYSAYPSAVEPVSPSAMWDRQHPDGLHRSRTINQGCAIATQIAEVVHSAVDLQNPWKSASVSLNHILVTFDLQPPVIAPILICSMTTTLQEIMCMQCALSLWECVKRPTVAHFMGRPARAQRFITVMRHLTENPDRGVPTIRLPKACGTRPVANSCKMSGTMPHHLALRIAP